MSEKLVSVIIPLYNREDYILTAIDSLTSQTYTNIEILVIDDCSSDNSVMLVKSCKDKRVKLIENKKNMGISFTRNKGLRVSNGEYVALLDSDDIAMSHRVATQVEFLEKNKNVGIVGSNRINFSKNTYIDESCHRIVPKEIKIALLFDMDMTNPSLMMRREVVNEYKYDTQFFI